MQDGAFVWGGTAGGTADALTLTLTPAITAYATGMVVRFVAAADNTSATPTLSINGVAPAVIARDNGANLAVGDIKAGKLYEVLYSGTKWLLTSLTEHQAQNGGAQTVSGSSVVELPDNANAAQFVKTTVDGASVHLPDATMQSVGHSRFTIINTGETDFFVRPSRKMPLHNGDFVDETHWTLGTGWSIGSGIATKSPGAATDLSQAMSTEKNKTYEITFTVTTISAGSVRVGLTGGGTDVLGTARTTAGTYTEILTSDGNTTFVVRADASFNGSIANVICRRHEPSALALLRPKESASFSLLSNSTPHGVWSKYDNVASPPKLCEPALGPSVITTILDTSCALNDYQVLHFGRNGSGHLFVYVVGYRSNGVTVGTPTLVSTTSGTMHGAHLVGVGKVLFCYGANVYLAVVNGTNVTISSPISANVFPDTRAPGVGPKHAQIGDTVVVGGNTLQAIDCSGTTPTAGSAVTIGEGSTSVIGVFPQPNNRVVCFYSDDSGTPGSPFSIRARVATISGTTITPHTSSGINDVDSQNSYGILEFSKELYLIAYIISSNAAAVVAATVSGTSVTFGSPVTISAIPGSATMYTNKSFQNEMFQKISDTEAVLVIKSASWGTFVRITINGTSITVQRNDFLYTNPEIAIISKRNKIYTHTNSVLYPLWVVDYQNNNWYRRPMRGIVVANRIIKINKSGFIAYVFLDPSDPINDRNIQAVFVSTETTNEDLPVFPLALYLNTSSMPEEITPNKTALYGPSLPSGQILHYLIEGVC